MNYSHMLALALSMVSAASFAMEGATKKQLEEFKITACKTNEVLENCFSCYKNILESSYLGVETRDRFKALKKELTECSDTLYKKFLCENNHLVRNAYTNHRSFIQLLTDAEDIQTYLMDRALQCGIQTLSNQEITFTSTVTALVDSLKSVEG